MEDFRRQKRNKKNSYSKLLILLLLLLLVVFARGAWTVFVKSKEAKTKLDDSKEELLLLQGREANLQEEIGSLSTKKGVDEKIRTKFRVAKEGEIMVVLIDSLESDETSKDKKKESFWAKLWPF
ncbi:hypothetical protein COV42_01630 [Candidatus Campbellbacteria bacterium CG11_big_fil_rev_8_21_14_0_20_44_21]|uniref:Septum formation initiator n=1 Tax=Candidatus Campbellbacteria bacterium CG22_combo_CG10-13_8_21_14_all_43_18 TaxID=1974530 RepID=A0A2H0DY18_9BACT|nr:MAG: hypothetical protein COW82_00225 [Candidatus Campbellbacteria bacterium CG22_combo_CG10-13_8_21_14_all_43_18]PIR24257.1 MAG: hypothetical protein COV42_01630 [Candidatus Campbellbacteria bacterium CG11_big_fil_rev_8_21_14_0_20_44_21]